MKRFGLLTFVGLLAVFVMMIASCGGGPDDVTQEVPVDTTPPVVEEPVVEEVAPPPPPPELKEAQLKTVYFDFDKFNLRPDAKADLDFNFALLQQFPDVIIKIEGHCDERGTIEYNLSLGEKRANTAQDYLAGLGVDAARISVISYGKERPIDPGHTEDAWSKNRRAEFRIISQ